MSREICTTCKRRESGKPERISFVYGRMKVESFKDGLTCFECECKSWAEGFEEFLKDTEELSKNLNRENRIVRLKEDGIAVDWDLYFSIKKIRRRDGWVDRCNRVLLDLGIFSFSPKDNWEIVADGPIGLNPRLFLSCLYFTRREDIIEYAYRDCGGTLYGWIICWHAEVITKKEVMKMYGSK